MKKYFKIIMVLTLSIMLTGCGIKFGSVSRDNKYNFFNINNDNSDSNDISIKNVDISESLEGINNLDISIGVSNVNINYYDGDTLKISGSLSKYSKGINTEKKSNKFVVVEESSKSNNTSLDNSSKLTISIPRSFNADLEFSFGVGKCIINELELDNLSIESGVGELTLKDIAFNKLDLESGVGSVNLSTDKKTGEISIEGGVGETNISLGDIHGDLSFDGGMGSATIKVPENAPIDINTDSGIGNVKIRAKTSNEAKYKFDIEVGIGSVEITN